MQSSFKQLIPGNPGTSFVVALLYAIQQKYGKKIKNEDQLSLFTKGIINSRNTFFSGVINEIAETFKLPIIIFSNSSFIVKKADSELNKALLTSKYSFLDSTRFENLLSIYGYIVFSVDIYQFRKYHDYHFVCISKRRSVYEIFEPKTGVVLEMDQEKTYRLISSITKGLKDILICFCC